MAHEIERIENAQLYSPKAFRRIGAEETTKNENSSNKDTQETGVSGVIKNISKGIGFTSSDEVKSAQKGLRRALFRCLKSYGYTVFKKRLEQKVYVFICCPFEILLEQAEISKLYMPLRGEIWQPDHGVVQPTLHLQKTYSESEETCTLPPLECSTMSGFPFQDDFLLEGILIPLSPDESGIHRMQHMVQQFPSSKWILLVNLHQALRYQAKKFGAEVSLSHCNCLDNGGNKRYAGDLLQEFYHDFQAYATAILFFRSPTQPVLRTSMLWCEQSVPSVLISPAAARDLSRHIHDPHNTSFSQLAVVSPEDSICLLKVTLKPPRKTRSARIWSQFSTLFSSKSNKKRRKLKDDLDFLKLKDEELPDIDFVAASFQRKNSGHFIGFQSDCLNMTQEERERPFWSSRRQLLCVDWFQRLDLLYESHGTRYKTVLRNRDKQNVELNQPVQRVVDDLVKTLNKYHRKDFRVNLDYLIKHGVLGDAFVPHDYDKQCDLDNSLLEDLFGTTSDTVGEYGSRTWLFQQWIKEGEVPLAHIRRYLGERHAFYLCWVQTLNKALVVPCLLGGLAVFYGFISLVTSTRELSFDSALEILFNNWATVVFSMLLCVWCTYYTEVWKRVQIKNAVEWDVTTVEEDEMVRAEFKGSIRPNIVTREPENFVKVFYKVFLFTLSYTTTISFLICVLASVVGIMTFRATFKDGGAVASILPSIVNTITIFIFSILYEKLAFILNDFENHRTQTQYNDNLVRKLFMFQFVNVFSPLFYIAYFRNGLGGTGIKLWGNGKYTDQCPGDCMGTLTIQLASYLILTPLLNTMKENALPMIVHHVTKKSKASKINYWFQFEAENGNTNFHQDPTLQEYLNKVIQYGLVTMFAASLPLAPVIFLVLSKIDMRLDAKRLLLKGRRPLGVRAEDIGMWQNIQVLLNIGAVLNNAFLMAFTAQFGANLDEALGDGARLWFILIFEHVTFGLSMFIANAIPDISRTTKSKLDSTKQQVEWHFEAEEDEDVIFIDGDHVSVEQYI
eukprot:m.9964 g.9964  ORF g.9964 m.9964 type:complete len:1015 (-) comp4172_c0_seq2:27-3071(-)